MNGKTIFRTVLIFFTLFYADQSAWANNQTTVNKISSPITNIPKAKIAIKKMSLKITDIRIDTLLKSKKKNLRQWTATIVNTGNVPIDHTAVRVKGTQIYDGIGTECDAGTGKLLSDLQPKKTAKVSGSFIYELTKKLRVSVSAIKSMRGSSLSSKEIMLPRPTAVFQAFTFIPNQKRWTVIIKNTSPFSTSFTLSVTGKHEDISHALLATTNTKLLEPNETQEFSGDYIQFVPGDTMEGYISFRYTPCEGRGGLASITSISHSY